MFFNERAEIKRFQGCLVGAAVGDALGAPAEFFSDKELVKKYGKLTEMVGGGHFRWQPGQTTDDTDMAMAIVNSVVELGRYDAKDIASRFVGWMKSGPRDIGGMTKTGLSYIADGLDHRQAGWLTLNKFTTAPNGSIMRTAPIGLIFSGLPEQMNRASDEVSGMTHAHSECLLACRMTCQLVSNLTSGVSKDASLDQLKSQFADSSKAISMIDDALRGEFYRDVYGSGGYVFESFNIALHGFMTQTNFEDTLIWAVSLGGDTDSQATVAGAFAGAHYGIDAIPKRWKKELNPYSSAELEQKARIIYAVNKRLKKAR